MLSSTAGAQARECLEESDVVRAGAERLTGAAPDGYSAPTNTAGSPQAGQGAEFTPSELLREGCVFLAELHRVILQTAELYRVGNEQDGNGQFIELTHGLEWFVKLVSAAQQIPDFTLSPADAGAGTAAGPVDGLNDILTEIVSAQEQRDLVLLTDLLEYELAPQVKSGLDMFVRLRNTHEEQ